MTQSIAFPPPAAEGRARTTAAILTIGYATTVAMWAVGYVSMMNPGLILGEILFGVMLACLLVGGLAAGRFAGLTWKGGAAVGAVAATLNLMLVGSLISAGGMNGVWWVVGNYAASIALGASVTFRWTRAIRASAPSALRSADVPAQATTTGSASSQKPP